MKKMTFLLLPLLLLGCLILPVSAGTASPIADHAGLLSAEEIADLEERAAALSAAYGMDVVLLTVDSLGNSTAQDYADDYYDASGCSDNGLLFLLAMEQREWYLSTSGTAIYALTDYGLQQLGEGILPYLSSGYWYDGFCFLLESLPYYLEAYENGTPIDGHANDSGDYYHGQQEDVVYYPQEHQPSFFLSLMIGLAAGGIGILIMRSAMNTKHPQRGASVYLTEGSWNLRVHQDIYLYSNVTKTRRQQNTTGRGGSTVHRSSGGRRHGGGGGKF